MKLFNCKRFALLTSFFLLGLQSIASAQTPATAPDWETLRPEGEEFTVLMPKGSTFESSKEPYHKMELNTRMYISNRPAGPVFAVVSLSGIKSNPALYTEMQRMNSYVDAFKTLFAPKIRKDGVAKLTLVGEKTLQGNPGREYRITIGDLNGTVNAFVTRKRFYSIVFLNTKKEEAIQEEFLSSFVLPEKVNTPPAKIAAETPASANEAVAEAAPPKPEKENTETKPDEPTLSPTAGEPVRKPISGGVLNGKAISLPTPEYPAIAKQAKASGAVAVQVTVDEGGSVIAAHAVSGHPLLQAAAVAAARQAKFSPTLLMGEPVKVNGVIVYNFGDPVN
jgi:TonB family protein